MIFIENKTTHAIIIPVKTIKGNKTVILKQGINEVSSIEIEGILKASETNSTVKHLISLCDVKQEIKDENSFEKLKKIITTKQPEKVIEKEEAIIASEFVTDIVDISTLNFRDASQVLKGEIDQDVLKVWESQETNRENGCRKSVLNLITSKIKD